MPNKSCNKKAEASRMKSKEYRILTGQHQYEESFSATKIQELSSVSFCHQKQYLLKSEAYNTTSCNFSAKEARIHQKLKTLITSTRRCFSTLTHEFYGGFLAQKSIGSFNDLSKLSSTLQHLLITSDSAIGSGDILVASSNPSYLKDGCCRCSRGWIRRLTKEKTM